MEERTEMINDKKVLFSGMQATGNLTLGNYLGALKNWVSLSDEYECFYSVVDLHSITVRQDAAVLRKRARALLTLYIAAGLDPYLLSVPCVGTCRAFLDPKLFYLHGRIEPHDAV